VTTTTAVFAPHDDLRHRVPEGARMRDSLFWNLIVPEEELGLQVYTFVNHRGRAGYNVVVWGARGELPALLQHLGQVGAEADFDDWSVAGRRIEFDRIAHRDHSWGTRDWGFPQHWKWLLAHTPSGRALNAFVWIARGEWGFNGYVLRDGAPVAIARIDHRASYDDGMDQTRLEADLVDVEGVTTALTLESFGAVRMPHDDPFGTVIIEAACRSTIDGEAGGGQFETHWPLAYIEHLARSA
jgi:hypothetical protein